MPRRRILVLALMVYLSLDLSTPLLPGMFSFDDAGFFIDTVVEGKSRPARLGTGISMPRVIVLSHVADAAEPDVFGVAVRPDARGPDRPRVLPSERSSLTPSSLDDH
jgi:hypothetical protein